MERTEIIKALECCKANSGVACRGCPYMHAELADDESCSERMAKNVLSLINELTAENKLLNAELGNANSEILRLIEREKELTIELNAMRTAANSYKMHYEKLEAENEGLSGAIKQYEEERKYHFEMSRTRIAEAKADTVRKMQEMFDNRVKDKLSYHGWYLKETIMPSIAKEMLNDES